MRSKTLPQAMALALLLPLLAAPSSAQGSMAVAFFYLEGSLAYSAWAGIVVAIAGGIGLTIRLRLQSANRNSH